MKQCINCLSENISTIAIGDKLFYLCKNCNKKSSRVINNDGEIYTEKDDGQLKHVTVAALITKNNKILFLKRKRFPYGYGLPTGHLLYNESIEEALDRTIVNKTALNITKKKLILNSTIKDHCKYGASKHEWYLFDCDTDEEPTSIEESHLWVEKNKIDTIDIVDSSSLMLSRLNLTKKIFNEPQREINITQNNKGRQDIDTKSPAAPASNVLNSLPLAVVILNPQGKITYKNKSAQKLIDNVMENPIEMNRFELILSELGKKSAQSKFSASSNIKTKDMLLNLVANPIDGSNSGTSVTITNITDLKQKEARDVLAYRTSLSICSNSNYLSIIKTVLKQMFYSLDIVGSSLMTLDNDTLHVAFRYSKIDHKKRKPLDLKIGEGVAGWVAKNKTILAIPDTSQDPLYVGNAIKAEKSLLSVPVIYNEQVFGVLNVTKDTNKFFTEEEIKMVEIVASRIALAYENENLHQQTLNEKNTLEQVLFSSTDSIALVDKGLNVYLANKSFKNLFGVREKDEISNLEDIKQRFSKESYIQIKTDIKKSIVNKEIYTSVLMNRNKKNKPIYIKTSVSPFYDKSGVANKALIVKTDISDLKNNENLIQKQIDQLTALFKISSLSNESIPKASQLKNMFSKTEQIIEAQKVGAYLINSKYESISIPKDHKLAIDCIIQNKEYAHGYISNDPKRDLRLSGSNIKNIILIPLMADHNLFGFYYAVNKIGGQFTGTDLEWLNTIATRLSLKIQTDMLLDNLRSERKQLETILDNTADGISVIKNEENIVWNKAAQQITGFETYQDYFTKNPERRAYIREIFETARKDQLQEGQYLELLINNKYSEKIWIGIHNAILKFGQDIYLIAVIRDISKVKEIETQQKDFVYAATHELRTPLTIIKGYLSMILNGDAGVITDSQKKYFNRIMDSSEKLIALVEEMLKVARLEEHRVQFEQKPFEVEALIQDVIKDYTKKANDKKLSISTNENNSQEKFYILGDYDKTREALSNIVDNAIKYTKHGRIEVLVERKDDTHGTIKICDTGVGISPKDQKNIFQKFIRISNSESVKAGGTGLGLYIVKNLIEQQGGSIDVESKLGKGTNFCVNLPIVHNIKKY